MMKSRTVKLAPHRRQTGFSIIEVLVALLVLAIGLLGLAALQAQGLRFNHDAYVRSQATNLAYDIVDRMRANRANVAAYTTPDPGLACDPTDASINMDLSCWYESLDATLPGGDGLITANATANFYDVTVRWIDRTPRDFGGVVQVPSTAGQCGSSSPGASGTTSMEPAWCNRAGPYGHEISYSHS